MSGKITGLVWDMDLPQNEKYVLLAYADHADHEGNGIRPSYDLVAWKTGYTRQGVIQIVKRLKDKKILILDRKGGPDSGQKRNLANEWHIDVEAAPKTPPRLKRIPPSQQPLTTPSQQPLTPTVLDPSINDQDSAEVETSANGSKPKKDRKPSIDQPLKDQIAIHIEGIDPLLGTDLTGILAQKAAGVWRKRLKVTRLTAEQYQKVANSIEPFARAYKLACPDCAMPTSYPGKSFESWYTKLLPLMEKEARTGNAGTYRVVFIDNVGCQFNASDTRRDEDLQNDYATFKRENPNKSLDDWYKEARAQVTG